jgi:hypothetical protein
MQMQMQYMRESEPVGAGAVMAGAHVRPAEELVTALRKVRLLAGTFSSVMDNLPAACLQEVPAAVSALAATTEAAVERLAVGAEAAVATYGSCN